MSKSNSNRMEVYEFGRDLLTTNDLDPVYVLLYKANWERNKLCKFCLSYWCYYHCGTASWITDQKDFWEAMHTAANSKEYPRGTERRHFRGKQAVESVRWLKEQSHSCISLLDPLLGICCNLSYVMEEVDRWRGFGPWISFKVADMLERLDLSRIEFEPEDVFSMFDAPKKGALAMVEKYGPVPTDYDSPFLWAHDQIVKHLGHFKAPPRHERFINIQEIETILCKWKSHLNSHYEVGKDIHDIHHGLLDWMGRSSTVRELLNIGCDEGLWT